MLDLKNTVQDLDSVRSQLARRGSEAAKSLDGIATLATERKKLIRETEDARFTQRQSSDAMRKAAPAERETLQAQLRIVSQKAKQGDERLKEIEAEIERLLLVVPNLPHASVPDGTSGDQNVEVDRWGKAPTFSFQPREHWAIGESLGVLDFERAARVSGSRFAFYKGGLARLERALINFFLDCHLERGYLEILPPFLVSRQAMTGTGQLPKFELDAFKTAGEQELFLIPTAEVPVTNMHREEILEPGTLPLKYCAFSPCFRAEAGSYGKDVKGLIRQHQFEKVELVHFSTPEESYASLDAMVDAAREPLRRLGLHHRVMALCTGDMGFSAAKTFDIEVWLPGQNAFREISSCSNCEDFQARRASIRFRAAPTEKPRFVHTLNGSGVAVGRTVVAILENFQQPDGTVVVPEPLRRYMGGVERIVKI